MATTNLYKVGDCVYFETSSSSPYAIRRIEELIKTNGAVEAKCVPYIRMVDLPSSLVNLANRHRSALEEESDRESETLTDKQRNQLKHRELFLSRKIETLPATQIRGKCTVTLLNETESPSSYLNKEDTFFYTLVYDPSQKTLLADRGEIRVGSRFQAEVPPKPLEDVTSDDRDSSQLEILEYTSDNSLSDSEIDSYLMIAKSVGTFARALDHCSTIKQPSLHMSASTASRDVTIATALKILHQCNYDIKSAVMQLVPSTGPLLCRDEMEEWSASEANLFEEAMEKYGKDFSEIRKDFLPWKTVRNLVEYYYMWKTTDRHVQQKRIKAVEAESKLKQVYIPNYNSKVTHTMNGSSALPPDNPNVIGRPCESCAKTSSSQWYAWGPAAHVQCRLCQSCWTYWKKFGGLKSSSKLDVEKIRTDKASSIDSMDSISSSIGVTPNITSGQVNLAGGSSYPCRDCGKIFSRQEKLVNHIASSHPNRIHRCSIPDCGKEFKIKSHLIRHCAQAHNMTLRAGSPSRPIMKTRAAFYLHTNEATKVARRICPHLFRPRHFARKPFLPINSTAIKSECAARFTNGVSHSDVSTKSKRETNEKKNRGTVVAVSYKLGTPLQECPEWLVATAKDLLPQPERLAFTPPARGEDGQFIIPRPTPTPSEPSDSSDELANGTNGRKQTSVFGINNIQTNPSLIRKRPHENQTNGTEATGHSGASASKRRQLAPTGLLSSKSSHELYGISSIPKAALVSNGGRPKIATITRVSGRKQMISWVDAPDDVFFIANATTKQIRKQLPQSELRKGARKPWRRVGGKQHSNINTNNGNNNHTNGDSTNGTSLVRSNNNNDISQTV